MRLARELVARFHSPAAADEAERTFEQVFARHEVPDEVEEVRIAADEAEIWVPKLLLDAGLVKSTSDGRRMIQQAAVTIDGHKVEDSNATVPCRDSVLLKVGKRKFCRVLFPDRSAESDHGHETTAALKAAPSRPGGRRFAVGGRGVLCPECCGPAGPLSGNCCRCR